MNESRKNIVRYSISKIKEMTVEEIEKAMSDVATELAFMRSEMTKAKTSARLNGRYSDQEWFRRLMSAIKIRGRDHQDLQFELSRKKKIRRAENHIRYEQEFMNVARERLDRDLFFELCIDAKERVRIKTKTEAGS